jgi:hypothetical protein
MSMRVDCPCGCTFTAHNLSPGDLVACPSCRQTRIVPAPGTDAAPAPDENEGVQMSPAHAGKNWGVPQSRADEDYESDDDDRRCAPAIDRRFMKESPPEYTGGGFGSINAGVGGGLAMMAAGAVIFLVCMGLGRISIYGPILFVIGLIALLRGLFRSNE